MNKNLINTELDKITSSINIIRTEINTDPPPSPSLTGTPQANLVGTVLASSSSNVVFEPYTPFFFKNGKYYFYYYGWNLHLRCSSDTGLALQSKNVITMNGMYYGAISNTFKGKQFLRWHTWPGNGMCLNHFATSIDGINWIEYPVPTIYSGEDSSFSIQTLNGVEKLVLYVRPKAPSFERRAFGRMVSEDGVNWSPIQKIMDVSQQDYDNPNSKDYKKELYSMSVVQVSLTEFWGVANVFDVLNNTVEIQLMHSIDGITFTRYNDKPFIAIPDGVKQQYGAITLLNNNLEILVQSSKAKHGESTNSSTRFELYRYNIALSEVRKLIN